MRFGDILALLGLLVSAGMFYWLARQARPEHLTIEGHLLAGRTVRAGQFGSTMVAASTSLATVIIFFISTAEVFGLTLLFCGLTYLAGQMIFIAVIRWAKLKTEDMTTNADFWLAVTASIRRNRKVLQDITRTALSALD